MLEHFKSKPLGTALNIQDIEDYVAMNNTDEGTHKAALKALEERECISVSHRKREGTYPDTSVVYYI